MLRAVPMIESRRLLMVMMSPLIWREMLRMLFTWPPIALELPLMAPMLLSMEAAVPSIDLATSMISFSEGTKGLEVARIESRMASVWTSRAMELADVLMLVALLSMLSALTLIDRATSTVR
jgi:hypothetical protein